MSRKSDAENLPPSPLYLEKTFREGKGLDNMPISNAREIAISGNMYHKWKSLQFSQFEEGTAEKPTIAEPKPQQSKKDKESPAPTPFFDADLIKDLAAIDRVTDNLSTSPQIQKQSVNWVDEWVDPIDKKMDTPDAEITGPESETGDELFERVLPEQEHTRDNEFEGMKDSKFLSWLKSKGTKQQSTPMEGKAPEKAEKKDKKERKKKSKKKKATASEDKVSKKKKKKELRKILNKSLEMEDEIVSETLANIMAQQGHIERAREMYEKLSLIFPEKSSYFADIIGKLEEE